ncbi:MAG: FG-GAP repeat protein [candidate division BRC1 bacterium ADurb.BinA364]|nr:MAG: FG-GAP repeat protein [candidate division BRC1 bacterium ADurb.BinA364]
MDGFILRDFSRRLGSSFCGVFSLLAIAAAMQFWGLDKESFWFDEAMSWEFSDNCPGEVLEDTAKDVHPPLYYLGLYYWRKQFGDTDFALRAYSVFWSLLGLVGVFCLARDAFGRRAGLIALALGAVHPYWIYYAQETRMYAQAAALGVWGTWVLWRWMETANDEIESSHVAATDSRPCKTKIFAAGWAALYALCALSTILTHYAAVSILLAQGACALFCFRQRRQWFHVAQYMICALAVAVLFAPWLAYAASFRNSLYDGNLGWIPQPALADLFSFLGREYLWSMFECELLRWWAPCMAVSAILAILCCRSWRMGTKTRLRRDATARRGAVVFAWMLFGMPLIAFIISCIYHPVYFRPRFSLFMAPYFLALAGFAFAGFEGGKGWLAAAPLLVWFLGVSVAQQREPYKEDWRGAIHAFPEPEIKADFRISLLNDMEHQCVRRYIGEQFPKADRATISRFQGDFPHLNGKRILALWRPSTVDTLPPSIRHLGQFLFLNREAQMAPLPLGLEMRRVRIEETECRIALEGDRPASFTLRVSDAPPYWIKQLALANGWPQWQGWEAVADLNGDGLDDLIGSIGASILVSLRSGSGLAPHREWLASPAPLKEWPMNSQRIRMADLNGDGKRDLVVMADEGVFAALSTGERLSSLERWTGEFCARQGWSDERHPREMADIDGDGRDDLVGFGDRNVVAALSNGHSFLPQDVWLKNAFGYSTGSWRIGLHLRALGDVNGDGRADIVAFGASRVQVALSEGTRFSTPEIWSRFFCLAQNEEEALAHIRLLADLNGDGRADAVSFRERGLAYMLSDGKRFLEPMPGYLLPVAPR